MNEETIINIKSCVKIIFIAIFEGCILSFFITICLLTARQNGWILIDYLPDDRISYFQSRQIFKFLWVNTTFIDLIARFLKKYIDIKNENTPVIGIAEERKILYDESGEDLKVIAIHEGGHAVMAKALHIEVKEKTIFPYWREGEGGKVTYVLPRVSTPDIIKKRVLLCYAGFIAERLLLGSGSNGCMGSMTADLELANYYLRQYVILKDKDISLAGLECEEELVNKKIVELSIQWEKEAVEILSDMKQDISDEADALLKEYYQKKE